MIGFGGAPDVWHTLRDMLLSNIKDIDETNAEVVLLCFSDKIDYTLEGKKEILNFLENDDNRPTGMKTNLTLAWEEGLKKINKDKYNFITFLTDGGEQNVRGAQPFDECIQDPKTGSWDDMIMKHNVYMCFVRLTDSAYNEKIDRALNSRNNISILDGIKFPVIVRSILDNNSFNLNIKEQKSIVLNIPIDIINQQELKDAPLLFNLDIQGDNSQVLQISNTPQRYTNEMRIPVALVSNMSDEELDLYPEKFDLLIKISSNNDLVAITNSEMQLHISNRREKTVFLTTDVACSRSEHYSSFLFSESSTIPIKFQLKTEWGKFVQTDSKITAKLNLYTKHKKDKLNHTDFRVYVDGKENADKTIVFDITEASKEIDLHFDDALKGGEYLLEMNYEGVNIDNIYPSHTENFKVINTNLINPLKRNCIIVIIILLALLLVWKTILIRIFYPRFSRIRSLQISSPIFKSVKIKGARKVVFSTQKNTQNFLSRFFTGRIIYVTGDIWTDGTIEAIPNNKAMPMRLRFKAGYRGLPKSLKKGEMYNFVNQQEEKINIIIM